jgi:hypothetical protein
MRTLRQGIEGEKAVGQFLERLREQRYQVFHDLVGDGFNVDHVLIGPAGVFTIETKTSSPSTLIAPNASTNAARSASSSWMCSARLLAEGRARSKEEGRPYSTHG